MYTMYNVSHLSSSPILPNQTSNTSDSTAEAQGQATRSILLLPTKRVLKTWYQVTTLALSFGRLYRLSELENSIDCCYQ